VKNELLVDALMQYGMSGAKAELIRHNENMTYCVDDKFLMRIHKSRSGFNTTWNYEDVDLMKIHESELQFIEYLKECGIYVQSPIRNENGNLVTQLNDGTLVTMLTWVSGRTVNKTDLTEEFGQELGDLIGRMHIAAQGYRAANFIRYDNKLCDRLIRLLSSHFTKGMLLREYYVDMTNALELIGRRLKHSESEYILVHSDLSLSNILITKRGLVPIDFSLLGYSNALLDFGSVYSFIDDDNCRKSIIKAYEEVRGCKIDVGEIDYYFALQILLGIALQFELWMHQDWFKKRLPEWCRDIFCSLK